MGQKDLREGVYHITYNVHTTLLTSTKAPNSKLFFSFNYTYFSPTVYVHACVCECTHVSLHSPTSTHAVALLRKPENNLPEFVLLLD